jgi:uracil-DNA glycosylase
VRGVPDAPAAVRDARACTHCARELPLPPKPIFSVHRDARILIVSQAPSRRVHETGIPWYDASGECLRAWLGVTSHEFYDPKCFAILPVGLCHPGRGASGDLPPRPESAPRWFERLRGVPRSVRTTLWIGSHALRVGRPTRDRAQLAAAVARWREHEPRCFVLPHPSPRNRHGCSQRPWFERELLPVLRARIRALLAAPA